MVNEPIHVTDAEFEKTLLQSDLPVVVDFWAPWCGPCKMIAPLVDQLATEYGEKIKVGKLDADENQDVLMRYGVMSIPTLMIFKKGKLMDARLGAMPEGELRAWLDKTALGK